MRPLRRILRTLHPTHQHRPLPRASPHEIRDPARRQLRHEFARASCPVQRKEPDPTLAPPVEILDEGRAGGGGGLEECGDAVDARVSRHRLPLDAAAEGGDAGLTGACTRERERKEAGVCRYC